MKKVIFHVDVNSAFLSWEAFRQRNIIFRPGKRLFLQRKNVRTWFWCRPIMISITDLQKL